MVNPQLRRGFWIPPCLAIGVIFLSAQLPLFGPIAPARWQDAWHDSGIVNIYKLSGWNFGLHFGWWWILWLLALMLALGLVLLTLVFLKTQAGAGRPSLPVLAQVGAGLALALSFLPVLVASLSWLAGTASAFGAGALEGNSLWDFYFPTFAWYIMIVAYAYGFVGIARMLGAAAPAVAPSAKTNVFAMLALLIGILGGWLAIVFGHLALSQINRMGQKGREIAIFGLVLGYVWLPINCAALILFAANWSS